ncbi:MAG: hypothetical protein K2X52_21365 [Mycobacteriaceae bacterium]|nr:hypothetical protein [Mycobacteriaceae bacterium]
MFHAMFHAAATVAARWPDGGEVDLDAQCRTLTMRALGRSVLGLDLDERAETTIFRSRRRSRPLPPRRAVLS